MLTVLCALGHVGYVGACNGATAGYSVVQQGKDLITDAGKDSVCHGVDQRASVGALTAITSSQTSDIISALTLASLNFSLQLARCMPRYCLVG